jgi:hypothetical protein
VIRHPLRTIRRLAGGHYLVVRRTFGGWLVEEHILGRTELLDGPDLRREHVEVIAEAYAATRTHHTIHAREA